LPDLLERYPGRRGTATLRSVLAELEVGGGITKQELESRFARFLDAEGLPRPERNASIHLGDRFIVPDCLWRDRRLIVELDGHDVHAAAARLAGDPSDLAPSARRPSEARG
jgi:hypothetical protein